MTGLGLANYDINVLYQSKSANTVRQIEQKSQDSVLIKQWSKSINNDDAYQIIVADAADAVSVNFSGRCKFLQI